MTVTAPNAPAAPLSGFLARRATKWLALAFLVLMTVVVIGYAVLPIQSWLAQRDEISMREAELVALNDTNAGLAARVEALNSTVEVERMARIDHGLVMPGEEAYAVLPPAPDPIRLPESWPFTELATALGS